MILISGPAIARLSLHTRKWAHAHLHRGSFGPVTRGPGGVLYASLAGVEKFCDRQFDRAEIGRAVAGQPDRILKLSTSSSSSIVRSSASVMTCSVRCNFSVMLFIP
jgi:hypothetical protein